MRCVSPWYNHTGWLGVKHQLTYLLTYSLWMFRVSTDICLDDIFWNAEPYVTNLGIMEHHYKLESNAKQILLLFSRPGSQGLYNQNMTVSVISSELISLLEPNLVLQWNVKGQNVQWKYWIAVVTVKVTEGLTIWVDVYADNIFWTAELFVNKLGMGLNKKIFLYNVSSWYDTKLGMLIHYHSLECWKEKNGLLSSRSRWKYD